ncbi:IclR family transcriptional regulator [Candidatus Bipolaricaulota sp. J31]
MCEEKGSRVFEKGLEALELIAGNVDGLGVVELGQLLQCHRSTVYRYLTVLVHKGYVEKKNGRYTLGSRVLELASLYLERLDVRKVAHPFLIELAERLQVTVHLAQLAGSEILCIDKIETHRSLPLYSRIGRKAPVYCTGLGKALLAFSPEEKVRIILDQVELIPHTQNTITEREVLLKELRRIREVGYAVDREEHEEGIACIAAPILDFYNEPVAAVSVTDLSRKILRNEAIYAKEVLKVAEAISKAVGKTITERR